MSIKNKYGEEWLLTTTSERKGEVEREACSRGRYDRLSKVSESGVIDVAGVEHVRYPTTALTPYLQSRNRKPQIFSLVPMYRLIWDPKA